MPRQHPGTSANRFLPAAICGFLLVAVAIVFRQTIGFGFADYDDPQFVRNCPQVAAGLTNQGIYWAFTSGPFGEWYPLSMISHMFDCQLFGLDPPGNGRLGAGGHHLTNVLLHAVTSVGLFLVLWRMTREIWPSSLAATLFAVHPQHVESVVWIAERRDVLSGLFFVLTLGAYLRYVRAGRTVGQYLLVALLLALGLMSKAMLVTVPALLLLLDYWPLGRYGPATDLPPPAVGIPRQTFWHLAIEKLPWLAIALADCAATLATHFDHEKSALLSWPARISGALVSLATYLFQFCYPVDLAAYYPVPAAGYPAWQVAGAAAVLSSLTALAIIGRRRFPYCLVGWFWFVGMMLPVLGLIRVADHAMADRYMYLPGIGLAIAVSWGAARLVARLRASRAMVGVCAAMIVAILIAQAARQTWYWRDGAALWKHSLAVTGENMRAEGNLGFALASADRLDEAIAHYRRALELSTEPTICNNFGIALARQGKFDEALPQFRHAAELDQNYVEPHANLGTLLALQKHPDQAIEEYQRAIQLNPAFALAHFKLAQLLTAQGQLDDAISHFQKASELQPLDPRIHAELAAALALGGRMEAAVAECRRAVELAPGDSQLRQALDKLIEGAGRPPER